jgi:hypothetical protein
MPSSATFNFHGSETLAHPPAALQIYFGRSMSDTMSQQQQAAATNSTEPISFRKQTHAPQQQQSGLLGGLLEPVTGLVGGLGQTLGQTVTGVTDTASGTLGGVGKAADQTLQPVTGALPLGQGKQ